MAFQCTPVSKGHVCLCSSALQLLTSALAADPQLSYGAACDRLCNAIPSMYHTSPDVADLLAHFEPKIEYMKANPNHYFYPLGDMHVQPGDPLYRAGSLDWPRRSLAPVALLTPLTPLDPVVTKPPAPVLVTPLTPVVPVLPAASAASVALAAPAAPASTAPSNPVVTIPHASLESAAVPARPAGGDPNEGLRAAAWALVKAVQRLQTRP